MQSVANWKLYTLLVPFFPVHLDTQRVVLGDFIATGDLENAIESSYLFAMFSTGPPIYIRITNYQVALSYLTIYREYFNQTKCGNIGARTFVCEWNYCQRARAKHVFGITDAMYRK